jgi:UDP:flavonoid glycosyltransferase YjiC (YdhE family)
LFGYSPHVLPGPANTTPHICITGYWLLKRGEIWQPLADLLAFLDEGPKPIYIGFGSMTSRRPQELAEIIQRALEICQERAIVGAGWAGLKQSGSRNERVFTI